MKLIILDIWRIFKKNPAVVVASLTLMFFMPISVGVLVAILSTLRNINSSGFIDIFASAVLFIVMLIAFFSFWRIRIRSRAEQEEKLVRQQVREIDLKLNRIRGANRAELSKKELQNLTTEFDALTSERNLLADKKPDSLDLIVFADWGRVLMESRIRLQKEEKRLVARNVANLAYGISSAIIGASFFIGAAIFSFYNGTLQTMSWGAIPLYYLLCVPITIISEVVAIFFLRLYSVSEQRIERNKNEITNIELRLTSGLMLYEQINQINFAILADTLSKEERNFVLGKNESSAGISADKLIEIITKAGATK